MLKQLPTLCLLHPQLSLFPSEHPLIFTTLSHYSYPLGEDYWPASSGTLNRLQHMSGLIPLFGLITSAIQWTSKGVSMAPRCSMKPVHGYFQVPWMVWWWEFSSLGLALAECFVKIKQKLGWKIVLCPFNNNNDNPGTISISSFKSDFSQLILLLFILFFCFPNI